MVTVKNIFFGFVFETIKAIKSLSEIIKNNLTIGNVFGFIIAVLLFDMAILFCTLLQIAHGTPTPHIPFWDAQIRLVVHLLG